MNFKIISPIILGALLSVTAFADDTMTNNNHGSGLFIEPAITYESGTLKLDYPGFGSSNENVKGFGLGARIGFHCYDVLFVAADLRYSKPRYESSALNDSADSQAYNGGVTLGVQTPLAGLRIWGTYIADGMLDPDKMGALDIKYTGFNGYRVGGGFYIATVSLNLEYQVAKYKSNSVSFTPISGASSFDNVYGTQTGYIASVSFPIAM